jgi:hypothetical protein
MIQSWASCILCKLALGQKRPLGQLKGDVATFLGHARFTPI